MPELFNACEYLLDRHVAAGDGDRIAITGAAGELTYAELHDRVRRAAAGLAGAGLLPEQRLMMVVADSPDFVVLYLAAMRIGAVAVPISTMLRADDIGDLVRDARARLVAVSPEFAQTVGDALHDVPDLISVVTTGAAQLSSPRPVHSLDDLVASATPSATPYPTWADSPAFWLYTSGTTGKSKGAMHRHGSVRVVCETYGRQVLGIRPQDRCLSAAKAFFAYGLGNSVLFPLAVGASTVLEPAPARAELMARRVTEYSPTLFFGGPTFFANMLRADLPDDALAGVRLIASAGEPLPAPLYERFTSRFGVDIIDGIGMTEMLHIFLSNREGDVRPGTTGVAVPGYDLRIVDEQGRDVPPGTPGSLLVRGDSTATGYWSRYDASRQVFEGQWLRTGDTYVQTEDGYYSCLGRTGDMLKASGMWVSPAEVEVQLLGHEAIAQAVVVAAVDADGLEKPVAYVILRPGASATEPELIEFCKARMPSYKCPRRILFLSEYPTTATGKIRRVDLRRMADAEMVAAPAPAPATG